MNEDVFKAEKREGGERYGESHYGPTRFYFSCKYEIFLRARVERHAIMSI